MGRKIIFLLLLAIFSGCTEKGNKPYFEKETTTKIANPVILKKNVKSKKTDKAELSKTTTLLKKKESEKEFYVGVYMYDYQLKRAAEYAGEDYLIFVEKQFSRLKNNGVNAVYLAINSGLRKHFSKWLEFAGKYNIKLIPQLDFAYFHIGYPNIEWSEELENKRAAMAADFINKYKNRPEVMAWSVREEIPKKFIKDLARYLQKIKEKAPSAKFNMIHSDLEAAKAQPEPNPTIMGTDRYSFWWEFSGDGYMASPSFSLNWVKNQFSQFQKPVADRNADYMVVVTQGGFKLRLSEKQFEKKRLKRPRLMARINRFDNDGRFGWKKDKESSCIWSYSMFLNRWIMPSPT